MRGADRNTSVDQDRFDVHRVQCRHVPFVECESKKGRVVREGTPTATCHHSQLSMKHHSCRSVHQLSLVSPALMNRHSACLGGCLGRACAWGWRKVEVALLSHTNGGGVAGQMAWVHVSSRGYHDTITVAVPVLGRVHINRLQSYIHLHVMNEEETDTQLDHLCFCWPSVTLVILIIRTLRTICRDYSHRSVSLHVLLHLEFNLLQPKVC